MRKIVLMSLVASSILMAGGYQIPETSTNAVALCAANVAHSKSADAAYYNPANMIFMADEHAMEIGLTYIGLDEVNYKGTAGGIHNGVNIDAEKENFIVPSLHYVSKKLGSTRIGVSIITPGGLSKRWTDDPGKSSAEEFTLETVEINPSAAFEVSDKVAVAVGFRIVSTAGVVKAQPAGGRLTQDMTGDSIDFGYNLALAYNPTSNFEIGVTYRSQVNLTTEGSADLTNDGTLTAPVPAFSGNYDVTLTIPLPAVFTAAVAYTLPTDTTVEFVYNKTYWSAYKAIDFNYEDAFAEAVFGSSKPKNWQDTETYRIGLTQELDAFTLMAGVVFDETPVPEATLGFELPDSDTVSVSLGGRYKINDEFDVALAALYSMHESRTVKNAGVDGEFTNSDVTMVSVGMGYKF